MSPEHRAREFVTEAFKSFGVPLEPYIEIIRQLIAGAEDDLRLEHLGQCGRLKADNERLQSELNRIYEWMREPDHVESPTLEWVCEWINSRPLSSALTPPDPEKRRGE